MKEPPLVSIIVPCYSQAIFLDEALDSVLKQTYSNWECIIVNDGSLDNTKQVAKKWLKKDKRFKYYRKRNSGLSATRNHGIKKSKGSYILPLDADDKISEYYLQEAVELLNNTNIGVVYCRADYFGEMIGEWGLPEFSEKELLLNNIVFCSAFFRRKDFNKTLGYNSGMIYGLEDWDFWLSLLEVGCSFYRIPKIHFHYRVKEHSMIKSISAENYRYLFKLVFINHFDLYVKYFGLPQVAFRSIINEYSPSLQAENPAKITLNSAPEIKFRQDISMFFMMKSFFLSMISKFHLISFLNFPSLNLSQKLKEKKDLLGGLGIIKQSGLFDEMYYLDCNPDVRKSGMSAIKHYLLFGGFEGRKPSEQFDSEFYLEQYPDVKENGMNPLLHYLKYGCQEGRLIKREQ